MIHSSASTPVFVATRWTLVLRARGASTESRSALSELCETYYNPVFCFIREEGRDEDAARELTQEFFARLLARGTVGDVDPQRGRFRSYLLGSIKHFLSDQRDHARRIKRGGGATPQSLDAPEMEGVPIDVADSATSPDYIAFDRAWALAVMDRALRILATQFTAETGEQHFEILKPWLTGDSAALRQAEAAVRLGISESAVKVAIHRLRKGFRKIIREEIAQTVSDPSEIDSELRHLVEVLATT